MQYASFQGRVYLAKRDENGNPIEMRSPGNVASLKLALKTDVLEHYESQTGQRSLDHRMIKSKSATIELTIEEFTKENLALALYGNFQVGTGDTVAAEPFGGATPVVGDRYCLAHPKVSSLIVKDSAGTPATLTHGTHYTADTDFGAIQLLDIAGFTPPFAASYSYGAVTEIGLFTQPLPERFLRFEGMNTAQGNAKVLVELYRVAFNPLKDLALISSDYNKFDLDGALLADASKPYDDALGQFGRITMIG
ncbi:MAG TPA: hypothetical protein VJ001_08905 [Rhodocyclaceae bacterium]|nr:hypothetical protein [Rhodocyclaceae bacterium]